MEDYLYSYSPAQPHLALTGTLTYNHLNSSTSSKQNYSANQNIGNNINNAICVSLDEENYLDSYQHVHTPTPQDISDSRPLPYTSNTHWRNDTQNDHLFYRSVQPNNNDNSNDGSIHVITIDDKQQQQQGGSQITLEEGQQLQQLSYIDRNANQYDQVKQGIVKNTYMNKINSLVTDSEQLKRESVFIQKLQKDQQFSEEILRDQRMQESQRNRLSTIASAMQNHPPPPPSAVRIHSDSSYSENQDHNQQNQNQPRAQLKQVRNRESARNSRKRKKIYVELLETKVAHLTAELEKTKAALESKNQFLRSRGSQTKMISLIVNQAEMLEKLEKCIERNGEETEINLLLDSLRFRMGASGKERNQVIEYFFKLIIDICIPAHFRYLLSTADQELDFFSPNPFSQQDIDHREEWRKQLLENLNLKDNQWNRITKFKKRFQQEKQNIDKLIVEMKQVKNSIQEKTILLESMVDNLRNYMDPIQSAKFLATVERNRYSKYVSNLRLWQALKSASFEEEDDEEEIEELREVPSKPSKTSLTQPSTYQSNQAQQQPPLQQASTTQTITNPSGQSPPSSLSSSNHSDNSKKGSQVNPQLNAPSSSSTSGNFRANSLPELPPGPKNYALILQQNSLAIQQQSRARSPPNNQPNSTSTTQNHGLFDSNQMVNSQLDWGSSSEKRKSQSSNGMDIISKKQKKNE